MTIDNASSVHTSESTTKIKGRLHDNSVYLEPHLNSRWRMHSFKVILPRNLSELPDSDLQLMLVSLKNAKIASTVHIIKIERELHKRGCCPSILGKRNTAP